MVQTEKIAIAQDGGIVSPHFGHCESYAVFQIENENAVRLTELENPGHEPGKLPLLLAEKGITTILAGGIGQRALNLFQEKQITVVRGVSGDVDTAAAAYAAGTLTDGKSSCTHGEAECGHHHGEGGHHLHHHDRGSCGCHGDSEHHRHHHTCGE